MNEWIMIFCMAWSGVLFSAGGTHIDGIGGQKWLRRYLLPIGLAIIALLSHVLLWKALAMAVCLMIALSQPYGSNSPYWRKALTFAMYGASFLWLGWSWWVVLMPCLCFAMFALSNWKITASTFFWKMCEFAMGFLIGVTFISSL